MRLSEKFNALKEKDEAALIIYTTAGFPSMKSFQNQLSVIAENGADIIEIGIPFSDPIADGPSIQASSQIGLENGATLSAVLKMVGSISLSVPLVFMSYLNPLLSYGREKLLRDMAKAGVNGLIIPDLPVEESAEWRTSCKEAGVDLIFLVTPVTHEARIQQVIDASSGFVYCVSLTGTTGARKELSEGVTTFLESIASKTETPVAVGFGVSTPEHIRKLKSSADGVIVGSRVIDAIKNGEDLAGLVKSLKDATQNRG